MKVKSRQLSGSLFFSRCVDQARLRYLTYLKVAMRYCVKMDSAHCTGSYRAADCDVSREGKEVHTEGAARLMTCMWCLFSTYTSGVRSYLMYAAAKAHRLCNFTSTTLPSAVCAVVQGLRPRAAMASWFMVENSNLVTLRTSSASVVVALFPFDGRRSIHTLSTLYPRSIHARARLVGLAFMDSICDHRGKRRI